jgi:LynF/TruF/PatF family peptide O-prenyltransferase
MIADDNTLLLSDRNLHFINEHKRAFQIESVYALDQFECFVKEANDWGLECSCKINKDKLYPIRFNLFRNNPSFKQFDAALNFFRQVEAKDEVKLDYRLMEQFLGNDFDFTKISQILVGVDLRKELFASRLKVWFVIEDYLEKLEIAITLCEPSEELRAMIVCCSLVIVGFDFYLDGRTTIELYPRILRQELQEVSLQKRLAKVLSPSALQMLDNCWAFAFGFSKANPEIILYCPTPEPDSFIANLRNPLAALVHNYYQQQSVRGTIVAFRERELLSGAVENLNLYYQMSLGVT